MPPSLQLVALLVCLGLIPSAVLAQSGANVLVVANEALPASVEIAQHYVERRGIPPGQLLRITTKVADEISRQEFDRDIHGPIAGWLARHSAQDRIYYLVLTKGIPLRIAGTAGRSGTVASVDSELTLLYRRMTGRVVAPNGPTPNPFFLGDAPFENASRFRRSAHDLYLVTRLDGFTVADAKALVDRSLAAQASGRFLLDQRAALSDRPNDWLAAAAARLEAQGLDPTRVVLEPTSRMLADEQDVLGYYSWGSNDPGWKGRHPGLSFVPGALSATFVSTDARTFTEPPADWVPGPATSRQAPYAGSTQSLTGDFVRAGVTGVAGYVAEPYLDSSVRPDILFPAYLAGFNLAEAFYLAMPALGWQGVVIGDPLCAPFAAPVSGGTPVSGEAPAEPAAAGAQAVPIPAAELDPPIDADTELPTYFSARRLAAAGLRTDQPAAASLYLRAQARLARDDKPGAQEALEQAVALDQSLVPAWRLLGSLHEDRGAHQTAAVAWRRVLEHDRKDVMALNNLAFALAVHEGKPEEALPLAERALLLAPRSASIADTVGWIKHLLGDHAGALKLLEPAAKALPGNADIQLHAAAAYAALGRVDAAATALKAAEAADPAVKDKAEYRELRKKVGG